MLRRIQKRTLTRLARLRYSSRAVRTLLDDLDAFYLEHRRCGRLDSGVENERVWMTCECGARLFRAVLREGRAAAVTPLFGPPVS
jgi:hypothetical protein